MFPFRFPVHCSVLPARCCWIDYGLRGTTFYGLWHVNDQNPRVLARLQSCWIHAAFSLRDAGNAPRATRTLLVIIPGFGAILISGNCLRGMVDSR